MSYKVVQVNGPTGDPTDVSKHITDGYTPVGGVSAVFSTRDNLMKYFQGMYKPPESRVIDSYYRDPPRADSPEQLAGWANAVKRDGAAALRSMPGSSAPPAAAKSPISITVGPGGRRTRRSPPTKGKGR